MSGLLPTLGRCRVVEDAHGGPQAMGILRAMWDEFPVLQLECAHCLLLGLARLACWLLACLLAG